MEAEILKIAAQLMTLSARTAPKSRGEDFISIKIIEGDEVLALARAVIKYGEETKKPNFDRDGKNLEKTRVALLVGIKDATAVGLDCGACGHDTCAELEPRKGPEFIGPFCALRLLDMGIAIGSAVKTASILNVDNRIMYRIGAVARKIGMVDWDFVMGIPLSATGKNIYLDR